MTVSEIKPGIVAIVLDPRGQIVDRVDPAAVHVGRDLEDVVGPEVRDRLRSEGASDHEGIRSVATR